MSPRSAARRLAGPKLSPEEAALRRKLAWQRAAKVAIYGAVGWVLVIGVVGFLYLAVKFSLDPALVAIVQVPIAAAIAGAHKRIRFRAAALGVDLPDVIDPAGIVPDEVGGKS